MPSRTPMIPWLLTLALCACPALSQGREEPPPPTEATPPRADPAPLPGADELELIHMIRVVAEPATVEELLEALERADGGIRTFQGQVMYDRRFHLQGDRHVRYGDLYYATGEPEEGLRPRRMFSIDFRTLIVDGSRREDLQQWIFDGEWLVERRPADRQYIARQVALPDDPIDPLALGESPIPFPMGQKKEAILRRYEAEMLPPASGLEGAAAASDEEREEWQRLRESVRESYQLRLVPREPYREDDQFTEIRLWYTKDGLLPRLARTVNRAGDESFVLVVGARVNETLPRHAIQIEPPPAGDGWDVQVESRVAKGARE